MGIAVSLGKRYNNICIIQDDHECRNFFVFFLIKTHICLQESMSQDLTCWSSGQGAKIQHASKPKNQNIKTEAIL